MCWAIVCTLGDAAYRALNLVYMILGIVYMGLASEHYIRTYHPSLLRRRRSE